MNMLKCLGGNLRSIGFWSLLFIGCGVTDLSTLTGQVPPAISVQPNAFNRVNYGGTLSLSVAASGDPPLKYQWWHDGKVVPGGAGSLLTTSDLKFTSGGIYWVVVTNSQGSATSSNALVEVSGLPWISQQPVSQIVEPTQAAGFKVRAQGIDTSFLGYQWYKDGVALPGANNPTLSVNNVGLPDQGTYHVVVGSFLGGSVQSSNVTLTISRAPADAELLPKILAMSPPSNGVGTEGVAGTFHVTTVGWKPLSFQWLFNGQVIPGATNADFSISEVLTNHAGTYSAVVTNAFGGATNSVTFAVNSTRATNDAFAHRAVLKDDGYSVRASNRYATLEAEEPPPRAGVGGHSLWWTWTAPFSGVATFNASASGFSAVVSVFHGDTLNELIPADQSGPGNYLANVQMDQGETVQVSVDSFFSDGGGAAIALTFLQDPSADAVPSIASSLPATNLSAGDTLTFSVTPAGAHPLHAQWFKDGVLLPQFTGTNLVITNIQAGNGGSYFVTVTNRNGTASTPAVQVTVSPSPPVFLSVPSNQWVTEGYPLRLEASAKGTAPLEYQWKFNGKPLVGETNPVFRHPTAAVSLHGQYSVAVSNSLGGTNSSPVSVSVLSAPIRYQWFTLAGSPRQSGVTDGRGPAARFWSPSGITRDRAGNLIVADAGAGSVRLVTPNGDVSTIAKGFGFPVDVEVEGDGSILVQDQQRQVTYRMFADGMRSAHSGGVWGVALSPDGFVYQLTGNGIQRIETNGLSTVLVRNLNAAVDATFDSSGAVYIAEAEGPTIREFSSSGHLTILAGKPGVYAGADGLTDSATFYHPNSVSFDAKGNLFVADEFGPTIRKVDPHGTVTTVGGLYQQIGAADGVGANARFAGPRRVLATPDGVLYVVDTDNHTIRVGTPLPMPLASMEAGQFQVIWSKDVDGFVLETATSLSADAEWRPASGTIIDNGNQWVYRESTSEGPRYFRLRHP